MAEQNLPYKRKRKLREKKLEVKFLAFIGK